LLFLLLLANLPHGGFPPYSNPILRSGELCRHSKINNAQDISKSWNPIEPVDPAWVRQDRLRRHHDTPGGRAQNRRVELVLNE